MEDSNQKKRTEEIIKDLSSRNERLIIGALNRVPHEGSPEMIAPLFNLYHQSPSKDVRILLEKTLYNLKDASCIPAMVALLRDRGQKDVHREVLSAIWQSGLDITNELALLIDIAIDGDYLTAFEVVTIIEQLEFNDDNDLTTAISRMDDAVERKGEKQELLVSLRQLLLDKLLGEQ